MRSNWSSRKEPCGRLPRRALEKDTGARALRAIIEEFMLDIMYEIPKDDTIGEVVITREYVEHTGGPRIIMRGQEIRNWVCGHKTGGA